MTKLEDKINPLHRRFAILSENLREHGIETASAEWVVLHVEQDYPEQAYRATNTFDQILNRVRHYRNEAASWQKKHDDLKKWYHEAVTTGIAVASAALLITIIIAVGYAQQVTKLEATLQEATALKAGKPSVERP